MNVDTAGVPELRTSFRKSRENTWSILTTITLTFIGSFLVVGIIKELRSPEQTELTIELSLQGRNNRPIADSEIWLIRPHNERLGLTNKRGLAHLTAQVPRGKAVVIEATGATFKARREILIPNVKKYSTRIVINPKEALDGRVELRSISMEEQKKKAVVEYSRAVEKNFNSIEKSIKNVSVKFDEQQPALQPYESDYLRRVRDKTERTIRSMQYSLISRKIATISLRLLRSQELFVEFRLLAPSGELLGARLVNTKTLRPQNLRSVITEAFQLKYGSIEEPELKLMMEQPQKTNSLLIRKRPIDDLVIYLNGHMIPMTETRDQAYAALPTSLKDLNSVATIAATSAAGVLVSKQVRMGIQQFPLQWNWPEWSLAQSQGDDSNSRN